MDYSDATPDVTYNYDRRERPNSITRNGITSALAYNDANQLTGETYAGGSLANLGVAKTYDNYLRLSQTEARNNGSPIAGTTSTYGYNATSGRLETATQNDYSSTYSYVANSPLISQITFKQGTTPKMTTTKQYDKLNRLMSISSVPSGAGSVPVSSGYQYNDANQRTRAILADGSFWIYEYDPLGQVASGKKYWTDGTPVPGQQFEYGFDEIGNRTGTKAGGDQSGSGLRPASYNANSLNQYSSRTVPGAFDVLGLANASASVTVNSCPADYRRGEYFQELVIVNNTNSAVWQSVNVTTSGGGSASGNVFVSPATESFTHDTDGNLTIDGRWNYTWDGENRLIQMATKAGVAGPTRRLEFEYDWQGRRIRKKVYDQTTGGTCILDNKFLYDGWNLIAELNGTNNTLIRSYLWGSDLSGTLQGAGGVGGLLKMATHIPSTTNYFLTYDGNGNVMSLVQADSGTNLVSVEYGPFGESIRLAGFWATAAKTCPFQFSTKYLDDETDLLYYGHRYLNVWTGRWPNRDPIGKRGGKNLYGFVKNCSVCGIDFLGLKTFGGNNISELSEKGGLQYSCNCGWIDGTHLELGKSLAETIIRHVNNPNSQRLITLTHEAKLLGIFSETYSLSEQVPHIGSDVKVSLALEILIDFVTGYESHQNVPGLPSQIDSSFSVEDLPSFYLGGLLAVNSWMPGKGLSFSDLLDICQVVDVDGSKRMFQLGSGSYYNKSFKPSLWIYPPKRQPPFSCLYSSPCENIDPGKKKRADELFNLLKEGKQSGMFTKLP